MISRIFLTTLRTPVRNFRQLASISAKATTTKDTDCECVEEQEEECINEKPIKCNDGSAEPPYNGAVNILPLKRPEFPGQVRMGFIPEEWFQFFYPKTGVTGPYMFGAGLITYLLSKEIYVLDHEFYSGLSLAILLVYVVKKFGPATAQYADKEIDALEAAWEDMHKKEIESLQQEIELEKKEQWRAEGALMLIEAKRAMIDMQLETAYREELMKVYNEIIKKLDYEVACANVERRLSRKHMMFWIHDQVLKAIGAEKDDPSLEKTKADLSAMVIRLNDIEKEEMIRESATKTPSDTKDTKSST